MDSFDAMDEVEAPNHLDNNTIDQNIPKIGMNFNTIKEAYDYYNGYARMIGFSIRKQRTNRSKRDRTKILRYTLCCSCEGSYTKVHTPRKRREERRFGCKAQFDVKLNTSGKYELIKFVEDHTHELVPLSSAHHLRSQREITTSQAGVINKMYSSGIQRSKIYSYFRDEAGGAANLNFKKLDCNNMIQKIRSDILKKGDAECLHDYFKAKKQENNHFFYSIQTNDEYELCGVFFCDAISIRDYSLFGDAVCFDTTFKTNNYKFKCAPFVGINNHGQTILFGCGLLQNETIESFVWLFTTFLEAMGGKPPTTIFTDQDSAMANAIINIFPDTHHQLCLWHIQQNALKKLAPVYSHNKTFSKRFQECIYEGETIEEFEEAWQSLIKDFNLEKNQWLKGMYQIKEKWVQVYARSHFCAGMTTTQRSESINKYLKMYFNANIVLRQFVDQYDKAMVDRREKEREENTNAIQTAPILLSKWPVEHEASKIYTRKIFSIFQEEYRKILDLQLRKKQNGEASGDDDDIQAGEEALEAVEKDEDAHTYVVEERGSRRSRTLTYKKAEELVFCTCRKFEFQGVLCSHALKLFHYLNFKSLPTKYYLRRWTKRVIDEVVFDSYGKAIRCDIDPMATTRYSELSHISQRIVAKSSKSNKWYSLAKSELLQIEAKLEALANEEDKEIEEAITKVTRKQTRADSFPDLNVEAPLQDPKRQGRTSGKRKKGILEKIPKKRNSTQKVDEEKVPFASTETTQRAYNLDNPIQVPLGVFEGSINQLSYGQVQNGIEASEMYHPNQGSPGVEYRSLNKLLYSENSSVTGMMPNMHQTLQDPFVLAQHMHRQNQEQVPISKGLFPHLDLVGADNFCGPSIVYNQLGTRNTGVLFPNDNSALQKTSTSRIRESQTLARKLYFPN